MGKDFGSSLAALLMRLLLTVLVLAVMMPAVMAGDPWTRTTIDTSGMGRYLEHPAEQRIYSAPAVNPMPVAPVQQVTIYQLLDAVAATSPGIGRHQAVNSGGHIGVTIVPDQYASADEIGQAVYNIIDAYAGYVRQHSEEIRYLRVGLAEGGVIMALWDVTPSERRAGSTYDVFQRVWSHGKYAHEKGPSESEWRTV
jgi:hypothetical protein